MIEGGVRKGKNYCMLFAASKAGAVIYCSNKVSEKRVLEQAKQLGLIVKTMVSGIR